MALAVSLALLFLACGYAVARGGPSERWTAVIILAGVLATHFAVSPLQRRFHGFETGLFLVDLAVFAAMVAVALKSESYWPLWMSAMQGVTLLSHTARLLGPEVLPWVYWRAVALWIYPMLTLLVGVTWLRANPTKADRYWRSCLRLFSGQHR